MSSPDRNLRKSRFTALLAQLSFLVLVNVTLSTAAVAAETFVMRVSHEKTRDHWLTKLLDDWGKAIETQTQGTVKVKIYPNAELLPPDKNLEAVKSGKIEAAFAEGQDFAETAKEMTVLLRPYGFPDKGSMERFFDSTLSQELSANIQQTAGVKEIGWIGFAFLTAFVSDRDLALTTPQAFQGKRVRSPIDSFNPYLIGLGAVPVVVHGKQGITDAFDQGKLDTVMTDITAANHLAKLTYATAMPMERVLGVLYVSPTWWAKLPANTQATISKITRHFETVALDRGLAQSDKLLVDLPKEGMKIRKLTPQQDDAIKRVAQPAFDASYRKLVGAKADGKLQELAALSR